MINWILNIIGIATYFLGRFKNRKHKTNPDFWFWLKDNWVELTQTMLINIALMIILMMPDVQLNADTFIKEYLPIDFTITPIVVKALASFLLGWVFTFFVYRSVSTKTKK